MPFDAQFVMTVGDVIVFYLGAVFSFCVGASLSLFVGYQMINRTAFVWGISAVLWYLALSWLFISNASHEIIDPMLNYKL